MVHAAPCPGDARSAQGGPRAAATGAGLPPLRHATPALEASEGRRLAEHCPDPGIRRLAAQLEATGGQPVMLHAGPHATRAAAALGVAAFALDARIVLGQEAARATGAARRRILLHEMVHVAQAALGRATGRCDPTPALEAEAEAIARADLPPERLVVRRAAAPDRPLALFWLLPAVAGAYVLLRPNVANAPGPGDKTYPSVSEAQVAAEALALFAVPAGAYSVAGRLGLGFYGQTAISAATANVSLRGVEDVGQGRFSGVRVYVFDAVTGAVIGVVVPGGVRLVGSGTTRSLDWLAMHGMRRSDLLLAEQIAARAARTPLGLEEVQAMFQMRNSTGRMADWWLSRRGYMTVWRGQGQATPEIISPLARDGGIEASEALVRRMRDFGLTDGDMAFFTSRMHGQPVPSSMVPIPELVGERLGAVGIPTSRLPGVARGFAPEGGALYFIRLPRGSAITVPPWGLSVEHEMVVLSRLPPGSVVQRVPLNRVTPLTATSDEAWGQLVPLAPP